VIMSSKNPLSFPLLARHRRIIGRVALPVYVTMNVLFIQRAIVSLRRFITAVHVEYQTRTVDSTTIAQVLKRANGCHSVIQDEMRWKTFNQTDQTIRLSK